MRVRRRYHRIHGDLSGTAGPILEPDGHGETADELPVDLALCKKEEGDR